MFNRMKSMGEKNMKYHENMKNILKNENSEENPEKQHEFESMLIHPYLNPDCEFYKNDSDEILVEIKNPAPEKRPFAISEKLELIEVLKK